MRICLKQNTWKENGAFTLLELVIVIIILGILATLGARQYNITIEKSRYAEAKKILGQIRKAQKSYYLQWGGYYSGTYFGTPINENLGMDPPPGSCTPSNYFKYYMRPAWLAAAAIRCMGSETGKPPNAGTACEIDLQYEYSEYAVGPRQDGEFWSYSVRVSNITACLPYSP